MAPRDGSYTPSNVFKVFWSWLTSGGQSDPDVTAPLVRTTTGAPASGDILNGYRTTTGTLITVPAGQTWVGEVGASASCSVTAGSTATGLARAVIATSGSGAVPAGDVFGVEAKAGSNAATGTAGNAGNAEASAPLVVAAADVDVTLDVTITTSGTTSAVHAWASGALQ